MGRSPCCEKTGLKKGPWTVEEDQMLVSYIHRHGHGNWRALPKKAGLLRCGKSCRLRWINYLRPDIKRGSFTKEEEETIVTLHAKLGNRWSTIAAKLPGRTDNEIKNVWHTHLKKRACLHPSSVVDPAKDTTLNNIRNHNKITVLPSTKPVATKQATPSSSPQTSACDFSSSSPIKEEYTIEGCGTDGQFLELSDLDQRLWPSDAIRSSTHEPITSMEFLESKAMPSASPLFGTGSSCQNENHNTDSWVEMLLEVGELPTI